MTFREGWLLVDDIPTRFLTCGKWVEDLENEQNLVFIIPGNPGVAEFYIQFVNELHENLKMPVWAVCHAGHEVPPESKEMKSDRLYDLQEQINHKATILRKFVPRSCRLHIIGHSMGAKMALELLKISEFENRVEKCYMLFPTVERIADTRNAQFIQPFVHYLGSTVIFLSWIFSLLPSLLQYHLLNVTFRVAYGDSNDCTVHGGMKLIQPLVLKNVFYLVKDEMVKIKDLDVETFSKYKHKFKFYYGTTDGWSPLKFYMNLKDKVPDVDAVVCDKGIQHAFTIKSSSVMANIISNWIQESVKKKMIVS